MFYAIVTSNNDFFRECYGTLWNFTFGGKVPELYGTFSCVLWNGKTMVTVTFFSITKTTNTITNVGRQQPV